MPRGGRGPCRRRRASSVRCIYDALAADYARTVIELGELTGTPRTCINTVERCVSQNRYMNQATANACGIPVFAGPTEGTAPWQPDGADDRCRRVRRPL